MRRLPPDTAPDVLQQHAREDGFIVIDPLYSDAEIERINVELERVIAEVVPRMPPEEVYYEDRDDRRSIKQLQRLFEHDAFFGELMREGPARRAAEAVLGEDVRPVNMQFFNKPPGIGQATPAHQDGRFFHLEPPQAVTGWLALEPVDRENGCLHYVRGSHRGPGYRDHAPSGVLGFSQHITDFGTDEDRANTVAVPARPGTFLLHHAKTIHWAGANTSRTRSRRALGFIYYGTSATVDERAKAAYQAELDARLRAEGRLATPT